MSISIYLSIYLSIYIYVYIGGWFSSKSRYITGNICTYMPEYNMVQYNTMEQIIFQHNITQSNYIYYTRTYIHTYTHNIPARQTRNEGTCKAGPGRRGRHKERQNERERETETDGESNSDNKNKAQSVVYTIPASTTYQPRTCKNNQ